MKPSKKYSGIRKQQNRSKLIIQVTLGATFVVLALTSVIVDPVTLISKYQARIAPGSKVYNIMKNEIAGAYVEAYIFNVTNAREFLSGEESQLRVDEVGPFTYQEKRLNKNFKLDEERQELHYAPHITTTFVPELSIADPAKFNISVANTALLAITSAVSEYPYWSQLALNVLSSQYNTKAVLTMPAKDYLWGYDDPLLGIGNTIMPGWINFKKLGLLDRLYDNTRDYRIVVSVNNSDKFRIKSVNDYGGLPCWGYQNPSTRSRCNSFEDAYEGISYPTDLTPDRPIRLYRNVFCRLLDLDYIETRTVDYGPEAFLYKTSNQSFTRNSDTECLCSQTGCIDGMSDLSPCFYGLPVMLSNAHFYGADPKVYERIEGITPVEEEHGNSFLVERKLGTALMTRMTFQLNVPVKDVSFNREAKPFSNMVVPIAYFKVKQPELQDDVKTLFWVMYVAAPYAMLGAEVVLLTAGLCLLASVARTLFWYPAGRGSVIHSINTKNALNCEVPLIDGKERLKTIIPTEERTRK